LQGVFGSVFQAVIEPGSANQIATFLEIRTNCFPYTLNRNSMMSPSFTRILALRPQQPRAFTACSSCASSGQSAVGTLCPVFIMHCSVLSAQLPFFQSLKPPFGCLSYTPTCRAISASDKPSSSRPASLSLPEGCYLSTSATL